MADQIENVLVIGGLSSIGIGITKCLMMADRKVYFTGNDEGKLERLVENFNGRNPKYECESVMIDMTNLPAICNLRILNIPFHTIIVIPNPLDVDSVYSEETNDIDMLHPLFLATTIGPYLLIRKLLENGGHARNAQNAIEIRLIFITNVNRFNTLLHWRKQGFDNFLKNDERKFIGTKVTKSDLWKCIQLGLAMLSEYLHVSELHRVRSLTINNIGINDKKCASAVMRIMENYPVYEANRRNVFEPNGPTDKLVRGLWGLKEREFFIEYLQNKIKDHACPDIP